MMLNFNSYEDLKDKLQIRIYDPDFSRNLLEGKIVTYIGDFAREYQYRVRLSLGDIYTLEYIQEVTGKTKAEIFRDGLKAEYEKARRLD